MTEKIENRGYGQTTKQIKSLPRITWFTFWTILKTIKAIAAHFEKKMSKPKCFYNKKLIFKQLQKSLHQMKVYEFYCHWKNFYHCNCDKVKLESYHAWDKALYQSLTNNTSKNTEELLKIFVLILLIIWNKKGTSTKMTA